MSNQDAPLINQLPPRMHVHLQDRHRAVRETAQFFANEHLPGHLKVASDPFLHVMDELLVLLPDSAELTRALDDLLAAKDHAVRAAVVAHEQGVGLR